MPGGYSFKVIGTPVQKGNIQFAGGRSWHREGKRLKGWTNNIASTALAARNRCEPEVELIDGACWISAEFIMCKPKCTKFSDAPLGPPDLDKLLRALKDALTGVLWTDDSRVVEFREPMRKRWAEEGEDSGVIVSVGRCG